MIKRIVAVILLLVLFSIPALGGESCPVGSIRVGKARLAEDGTPVYVGIRWNTVLFRIGLPPWIKVWCIQTYAFENETSATTEVRAAIQIRDFYHWIFQQENPPAGDLYWFTDDFFLVEGERLTTRFTGTTSGDELHVYITGYRMYSKEGGV